MPALGGRGPIAPRELAKAAKGPTPKLPSGPSLKGVSGSYTPPKQPLRESNQLTSPSGLRSYRNQGLGERRYEAQKQQVAKQFSPKAGREERQQPKAGGQSLIGTIVNLPGRVEAQGYKNLASITGVPQVAKLGNLAAEAVNIPTQALPSAYYAGKALGAARAGKPQELHELAKNFAKESAIAHVVKGDFKGAVEAAGHHPLGTTLEVGAGAGAVDRALGAVGRLSGVEAAKLADTGATNISRAPREYPTTAVPEGGASVAQRPYHKGLVRPAIEKKLTAKPVPTGKIGVGLRKSYDRFEGEQLAITRRTRDTITKDHSKTVKGAPQASVPFGQWLADPKAINPATKRPFAEEHLQEMIDHLRTPPAGEFPHEAAVREANIKHLEGLQGQDLTKAYDVAQKVADKKRALEPELIKHEVYAPETIRIGKLVPAFRFHFRDQNPFVEPTVRPGESPFRLGGPEGKPISVDAVAKQLEAKGIHEKQLSFVSTRPFQNGNAPFRTGHAPGGARVAKGHLTGHAFMRGLFDPTNDAALRQHLTDAGIVNKARGDLRFSGEYVHTRAQIAKLLEARLDRLPPEQQTALRNYIASELKTGQGKHFENGQHALEAREHLRSLYPDIQLEPIRVGHPYATAQYRKGMGKHLDVASMHDALDPSNHGPEQEFWKTRVPENWNDPTAGPVGLAHSEIVNSVRRYEKDLGTAHLSRMPSSFWRKTNVAFSVRHVPGVAQEVGLRMLANNVGLLSGIRGSRAISEMVAYGHAHPDPFVKLGAQRMEAITGGTVASQALEQVRRTTQGQLKASGKFGPKLANAVDLWNKGTARPITGAPLRAVRGAVRAFNGTTNAILRFERKTIEHPPQVAGVGKQLNEEFQRLHGQRLKLIGSFTDVEKAFLRGQLDPKAIDRVANLGREYWGEWTRSSPEFKNWQRVSPFLQWYLNSLRFIYHTMPVHHPVKTGLVAAIEGATREKRLAEGQEYKGGLPLGSHLLPTDLEPSQQGSLPFGKERAGQEYYTPQGAVSAGPLESGLGALLPYASGIWMVAHGINPLTNRPLEEKNPETGKKQRITDANQLATLAALSAAESFVPPLRYAQSLSKRPASYVFRPLRTEKTRLEVPAAKAKEVKLGGKLGSTLGTKLGSSLK